MQGNITGKWIHRMLIIFEISSSVTAAFQSKKDCAGLFEKIKDSMHCEDHLENNALLIVT